MRCSGRPTRQYLSVNPQEIESPTTAGRSLCKTALFSWPSITPGRGSPLRVDTVFESWGTLSASGTVQVCPKHASDNLEETRGCHFPWTLKRVKVCLQPWHYQNGISHKHLTHEPHSSPLSNKKQTTQTKNPKALEVKQQQTPIIYHYSWTNLTEFHFKVEIW